MDFVDWCSEVLNKIIEAESEPFWDPWEENSFGSRDLAYKLFGEFIDAPDHLSHEQYPRYRSMYWAVYELKQVGLVEMDIDEIESTEEPNDDGSVFILSYRMPDVRSFNCRVAEKGLRFVKDRVLFWREICDIKLEEDQKKLLLKVNQFSPRSTSDRSCYWLDGAFSVNINELVSNAYVAMRTLEHLGLIVRVQHFDFPVQLQSTYKGLVWDTRQELFFKSKLIDDLVAEWETTRVDFKQELYLDTSDQKAEFIKDVLSLVNTQANGRRWLIIGFDEKHAYFTPPNPRVTQNRIEQIIAQYIAPCVDIRYEVVNYRLGSVGMLEVIRDQKKLPYCVMKEIKRDRKSPLRSGEIFVRHGSQVEKPTDAELKALKEESDYAKSN